VADRSGREHEFETLAWEKKGIFPIVGLIGTMIGVFKPEQRAEALFRGRTRSAIAFFVASFFPVAVGAFSFAHAMGGYVSGSWLPHTAQGVVASLAGALVLVASFSSVAHAHGVSLKSAARAALFLTWLVPLFLVDLTPFAARVLAHAPERAELFAAMCTLLPLLLALVGLEAAAKHGARISPRISLLMGVIPVTLAFSVGRVAIAAGGLAP
jgi:hypothetical protein